MSKEVYCGYHHTMPGRVRVRVTNLKGRQDVARSLEVLLLSQPGITLVRANHLTGNVLVRFDQDALSHQSVLQSLKDLGHSPMLSHPANSVQPECLESLSELGVKIGTQIAKVALKQALSGSPAVILLELL